MSRKLKTATMHTVPEVVVGVFDSAVGEWHEHQTPVLSGPQRSLEADVFTLPMEWLGKNL